MRNTQPTSKQRIYAHGILNDSKSKGQVAEDAGFGVSLQRHPARIDAMRGTKIAMAELAKESGNITLALLKEIQTRDLKKEEFKTLISAVDTISKAWERFVPKEKSPINTELSSVFGQVIDVTPIENKGDI